MWEGRLGCMFTIRVAAHSSMPRGRRGDRLSGSWGPGVPGCWGAGVPECRDPGVPGSRSAGTMGEMPARCAGLVTMFHVKPFGRRLGVGRACSAISATSRSLVNCFWSSVSAPALAAGEAPRMMQSRIHINSRSCSSGNSLASLAEGFRPYQLHVCSRWRRRLDRAHTC